METPEYFSTGFSEVPILQQENAVLESLSTASGEGSQRTSLCSDCALTDAKGNFHHLFSLGENRPF